MKLCVASPLPVVQIFSDSTSTVDITGSTFQSNVALLNGGAMYVGGSETLTITSSVFSRNEVGTGQAGNGAGGDVWANRDVELIVTDSSFSGAAAEAGGASIVCCGANIVNSNFSSTDVFSLEVGLSVAGVPRVCKTSQVRYGALSM